jgi:hypothetical protein
MTPALAQFSDWVLALLPRLFIYPGGLWMLAGVLLVRLAVGGARAIGGRVWLDDLLGADLPSLAVAMSALALLPLVGASALPVPVDRWALAALLTVSLLLDTGVRNAERPSIALPACAITLAILAPLAAGDSLVALTGDYLSRAPVAFGLAVAAVLLGLAVMLWLGCTSLAGQVRGLGWLALALTPVYGDMWPAATVWVFGTAAVVWFGAGRLKTRVVREQGGLIGWALATQWLLAFLALGVSLLAAR